VARRSILVRTDTRDGAPIELDCVGMVPSLRARWYNPREGRFEGSEVAMNPAASEQFTAPGPDDWVLLLQSAPMSGSRK